MISYFLSLKQNDFLNINGGRIFEVLFTIISKWMVCLKMYKLRIHNNRFSNCTWQLTVIVIRLVIYLSFLLLGYIVVFHKNFYFPLNNVIIIYLRIYSFRNTKLLTLCFCKTKLSLGNHLLNCYIFRIVFIRLMSCLRPEVHYYFSAKCNYNYKTIDSLTINYTN